MPKIVLHSMQDVTDAVKQIQVQNVKGDDETAHSLEDALYIAVLEEIAENGHPEAASLAKEALKTQKMTFSRRCA